MKPQRTLFILLLGISILLFYLYTKIQSSGNEIIPTQPTTHVVEDCTPTFADGGGPYYKDDSPFREKIVPEQNEGTKLLVTGKIVLSDCKTPVAEAVLDIWQANETGDYQDAWYRGKVKTDNNGNYSFESVVPKGYGEGTGYRPPHIHFKVFVKDTEIITSQMFFPEVKGTPGFEDAFIMKVEESEENGNKYFEATHTIVLP